MGKNGQFWRLKSQNDRLTGVIDGFGAVLRLFCAFFQGQIELKTNVDARKQLLNT